MDNKNATGAAAAGIKVTYIETQFVTSDAAGFKDLVQRLTGRSAPPPAPHRPLRCRPDDGRRGNSRTAAEAGAGPQRAYQCPVAEVRPAVSSSSSRTPTTYLEGMGLHDAIDMGDFSDLLCYVGATSEWSDGCYGSFPY